MILCMVRGAKAVKRVLDMIGNANERMPFMVKGCFHRFHECP